MIRVDPYRRRLLLGALGFGAFPLLRAHATERCVAAVSNILGPAYRRGAPFRTRLAAVQEPGTPLVLSGRISDAATCAGLAAAVLDVWQVNNQGDYDMDSAQYRLRGKFRADRGGNYEFATVLPVPYGARPKHIHFRLMQPHYEPRITQCYFEGDERNAQDAYVKRELIVAPRAEKNGLLRARFDIALERERPADADAQSANRDYAGIYTIAPGVEISVVADGRTLAWHLNRGENAGDALDGVFMPRARGRFFVPEYDFEVTFVRDEHGRVDHVLDSRGLTFPKRA